MSSPSSTSHSSTRVVESDEVVGVPEVQRHDHGRCIPAIGVHPYARHGHPGILVYPQAERRAGCDRHHPPESPGPSHETRAHAPVSSLSAGEFPPSPVVPAKHSPLGPPEGTVPVGLDQVASGLSFPLYLTAPRRRRPTVHRGEGRGHPDRQGWGTAADAVPEPGRPGVDRRRARAPRPRLRSCVRDQRPVRGALYGRQREHGGLDVPGVGRTIPTGRTPPARRCFSPPSSRSRTTTAARSCSARMGCCTSAWVTAAATATRVGGASR